VPSTHASDTHLDETTKFHLPSPIVGYQRITAVELNERYVNRDIEV
jgi:hypothetical protein